MNGVGEWPEEVTALQAKIDLWTNVVFNWIQQSHFDNTQTQQEYEQLYLKTEISITTQIVEKLDDLVEFLDELAEVRNSYYHHIL